MAHPVAILVSIDRKTRTEPITGYDNDGHVDYPETIISKGKTYKFICRTLSDYFYFEDASGLREAYEYLEWEVKDLRNQLTKRSI